MSNLSFVRLILDLKLHTLSHQHHMVKIRLNSSSINTITEQTLLNTNGSIHMDGCNFGWASIFGFHCAKGTIFTEQNLSASCVIEIKSFCILVLSIKVGFCLSIPQFWFNR